MARRNNSAAAAVPTPRPAPLPALTSACPASWYATSFFFFSLITAPFFSGPAMMRSSASAISSWRGGGGDGRAGQCGGVEACSAGASARAAGPQEASGRGATGPAVPRRRSPSIAKSGR